MVLHRGVTMNGFEIILPHLKPIEHLILDDSITEVMVNGPERLFVERDGFLQEIPSVSFDEISLQVAVQNIARCLGVDISEAKPFLDSCLPDGTRFVATIPPCSQSGTTLTISKPSTKSFEIADLIRGRTLNPTLAKRLEEYVLARKNILISGAKGAGKTTLLSSLSRFIPDDQRIVVVEDAPDMRLGQRNILRLEASTIANRPHSVTKRDLVEAAVAHRPDRIIVDALRGDEAFDLLEVWNQGHSGTLATIDADGALQAVSRFVSCVLRSGTDWPYRAIKHNIGESVNVVVHLERSPGYRHISEVLEINSYDPDSDLFDYCSVYLKRVAQRMS